MKNNIFSLVSYKVRKLKKKSPSTQHPKKPIRQKQSELNEKKARILKLRKDIDTLHELVSSL